MFQLFIIISLMLFGSAQTHATELASIALQYQPDIVVEQISIVRLEIKQQLTGLALNLKTEQKLEGEMKVLSAETDKPLLKAPFDVEYTPRRLTLQIGTGDRVTVYDSAGRTSHPYMAQLEHLINHPMKLHLKEDFSLDSSIESLDAIGRDLPQLKNFIPSSMLTQTFEQIFTLSGKALTEGNIHRKKILFGDAHPLPLSVDYEVTAANFKEVYADLRGKLDSYRIKVGVVQKTDENTGKKTALDVILTLSGNVKGTINWDRRNALLCQMAIDYTFQGTMKSGDEEVPIVFNMSQIIQSKKKASS